MLLDGIPRLNINLRRSNTCNSNNCKQSARDRLLKEWELWNAERKFGWSAKFGITPNGEQDLFLWYISFPGPEKSPWEGATYVLRLQFTNRYPYSPPQVRSQLIDGKALFHPNVFVSGTICLAMLDEDEDWRYHNTVKDIVTGVEELLREPNPYSPAQDEPTSLYINDREKWLQKVKEQVNWLQNQQQTNPEDNEFH